jgi:predicted transcriptional regulator
MNVTITINGVDKTSACMLAATRINYDSTKRIATASISVLAHALNAPGSDAPEEMLQVIILDGRDGVTKLFEGQIFAMTLKQSDTPGFSVFYQCDLNDWGAYLDRSVCWDPSFVLTLPGSDQGIILALLGHFCPAITVHAANIAALVPTIQQFDWLTKTCRQVLDDLSTLSQGSWQVDFDGVLHYYLATNAPDAPFGLSTSPDYTTTYPVRVDSYKRDFTNPINHAHVRGLQDQTTGAVILADYADPVSIQDYGEYASGLVDTSIVTGYDAALRAKSMVLSYAYPIETGTFTIWGPDGLKCGMKVHIKEENLGIDGDYTIISLAMQWQDASLVEYVAQFGAAKPDLETILRLLDQRTKWATSNVPITTTTPGVGTITDANIAPPGLSASSIQSVNAGTIQGVIHAGQIGTVNASTIIGQLTAAQIATVNASSIAGVLSASQIATVNASSVQGVLQANQIGAVNATTIQGVIVSSQLANQIIDSLSKYATPLTPVQMVQTAANLPAMPNANFPPNSFFYYVPDGNFYQINAAGTTWVQNNNPQGSLMNFFNIGAMRATSIVGLILAAQINSITAGQITGQIQAAQIQTVNASTIVGQVTAAQISTVNANAIQGTVTASQIATVNATSITGTINAAQIASVNASTISGTISGSQIANINAATITIGLIADNQIGNVSGAKLTVGTVSSDKLSTYSIDVGGGGAAHPARINVYDASNGGIAQIGYLDASSNYGGWFKVFGAGGGSYTDAKVKTDTSGNLAITDANLTVTNAASSTVFTVSPTTFDSTYSSVALTVSGSTYKTVQVSRGVVIYNGSTRYGSFAISPSTGWPVLEIPNPSGYIQLDGSTAICRADGGFQVFGTPVINNGGVFVSAAGISTTGQISTSGAIVANNGFYISYPGNALISNTGQFIATAGINIQAPGVVNCDVGFRMNQQQVIGTGPRTGTPRSFVGDGGVDTTNKITTTFTCNADSGFYMNGVGVIGNGPVNGRARSFIGDGGVDTSGPVNTTSNFNANSGAGYFVGGGTVISNQNYHYGQWFYAWSPNQNNYLAGLDTLTVALSNGWKLGFSKGILTYYNP